MRTADRGMALLATLGVLAVMLILAASFSVAVRTDTRLTASQLRRTQAAWLAEAGLQRALIGLRDNPDRYTALSDQATDNQPLVLAYDSRDEDSLGLRAGRFQVGVFDEAARLNLNTVSQEILQQLLPAEPTLAQAILDWRDTTAEPQGIAASGATYRQPDGLFETVPELLMLRDVSTARFYGQDGLSPLADESTAGTIDPSTTPLQDQFSTLSYDDNTDLDGKERLDARTADKQHLTDALGDQLDEKDIDAMVSYRDQTAGSGSGGGAAGPAALATPGAGALSAVTGATGGTGGTGTTGGTTGGATNGNSQPSRPANVAELVSVLGRDKLQKVYDRLTCSDDLRQVGAVNVNTATAEVLAALPGMDSQLADAIVQARRSQPFETVGDLLRLSEVTDDVFKQVAPLLTTRSRTFQLSAVGTVLEGEQELTRRITVLALLESSAASTTDATSSDAATGTSAGSAPTRRVRIVYRRME